MERKEAIEVIKKNWPDSSFTMLREALKTLIPELKESEDEMIRKVLIELSKEVAQEQFFTNRGTNLKNVIAWLEKQGEQIPANSVKTCKDEQKPTKEHNVCDFCEDRHGCVSPCPTKLIEEQKPADKVEPKFKVGDRIIGIISGMSYFITKICDDHYNTESGCIIMFYAQDNFKLYEQKTAWSEEDESMLNDIMHNIHFAETHRNVTGSSAMEKEQVNWLKSIKERVGCEADCTTTKEWSEDDDSRLKEVLYYIEYVNRTSVTFFQRNLTHLINWLNSLKPQNRWKPSDEQMKALKEACDEHWEPDGLDPLYTLYQDLKKLK